MCWEREEGKEIQIPYTLFIGLTVKNYTLHVSTHHSI
jgi:hypothetical protein